jgi:hypothetical protein
MVHPITLIKLMQTVKIKIIKSKGELKKDVVKSVVKSVASRLVKNKTAEYVKEK